MADMTAKERVDNFKRLKSDREYWDDYMQTVHDYFYIEAEDINKEINPGQELYFGKLYDSTPLLLADVLPAGFSNYMTPISGNWLGFFHRDPKINALSEVKKWYKEAEEEVWYTYENSNFYDQIMSFWKETGTYGTANMVVDDDDEDVVRFTNLCVKQCFITEDGRRRVNNYYCEFEFSAQQAVEKFGYNKVSRTIKKEHDTKLYTTKKHTFLLFIGNRYDRNPNKTDNASMPIMANWYDVTAQELVQEGGYLSMPAFSHRFYTRPSTPYGYSPAMKAMMDARYLQVMGKTELISAMQKVQPAYAFPHDAFLEPVNFNPLALNTYNSKNMNRDQMFPIGGDGNLQASEYAIQKRVENLKDHMFYNVFLAFQGITKEMTVPEVMQRANEQMTILGPAVGRGMNVLKASTGIVMNKIGARGRLPKIPDVMYDEDGNVPYEVNFTSVLTSAQKAGEIRALQNAIALSEPFIMNDPTARHKINSWRGIDSVFAASNADPTVVNDDETAMELVNAEAEAQAKKEEMEMMVAGAGAAKDAGAAEKNFAQAQQ
jgi:hypothetical protein